MNRTGLIFVIGLILILIALYFQYCNPSSNPCENFYEASPEEQMECLQDSFITGEFYLIFPDTVECPSFDLAWYEGRSLSPSEQECQARLQLVKDIIDLGVRTKRRCGCSLWLFNVGNDSLVHFEETILAVQSQVPPTGNQGSGIFGRNIPMDLGFPKDFPATEIDSPDFRVRGWLAEIPQNQRYAVDSLRYAYLSAKAQLPPGVPDTLSPPLGLPNRDFVKVGILDMGMNYENPNLGDLIWVNPTRGLQTCYSSYRGGYNSTDTNPLDLLDYTGHGTHIAGIITMQGRETRANPGGAITPQEYEDLRILPVKMTIEDALQSDLFSAICAIRYAIAQDVDVMNLSWGFTYPETPEALGMVLQEAKKAGILVVASAGNDSINIDKALFWPAGFSVDPAYDHVISVAALNADETQLGRSNYGEQAVQIAAPGTCICSYGLQAGEMRMGNGTSMAAPFVTRYAALLMMRNPTWTYQDVKAHILAEANTLSITGENYPRIKIPHEGALTDECASITCP